MLIKALPPTALVRTPVDERVRDPWTAYHELLAQLVEVTSIGAAEMKLRKPIKINRPKRGRDANVPAREVRRARDTAAHNPYRAAMSVLGAGRPPRPRDSSEE